LLASEVITELSKLDPLRAEWDGLAVSNQTPLMSPACVMAWWRHLAPASAEPRVIAVRQDGALVGLAPFYVDLAGRGVRRGLHLPGIELGAPLAPLAAPGHQQSVASALGQALAAGGLCPDLAALEGVPCRMDWAGALREAWPGHVRPVGRRYQVSGCPTVSLSTSSFDAWLKAKSSSFRKEMRRVRRQFAAAGGTMRVSTPDTLRADVDVFVRLHASRWETRGGSNLIALGDGLPAALRDIGQTLLDQEGRFVMRLLELGGEPISAQLFLSAGGRVHYMAAGWDERFAKLKPTIVGMLATIEDGIEHGEELFHLGPGDQDYKLRFADGNDPVDWTILVPAGARLPLTLLRTAPMRGRLAVQNTLKRRLSEKQFGRLRQGLHKIGAG
jgi:CelD/BcsL family acetyltransferase involved in cellulose biosynthesis